MATNCRYSLQNQYSFKNIFNNLVLIKRQMIDKIQYLNNFSFFLYSRCKIILIYSIQSNKSYLIIILNINMSAKMKTKQLLSKDLFSTSERLLIHNDGGTYGCYQRQLQNNISFILIKYPTHDKQKIRNLLEEIDNNRQIALEILQFEDQRHNSIIAESNIEKGNPQITQEEENRILKHSFLNLYRKLIQASHKLQDLTNKNDNLERENSKLKSLNKILFEGQFNSNHLQKETPIC